MGKEVGDWVSNDWKAYQYQSLAPQVKAQQLQAYADAHKVVTTGISDTFLGTLY